MLFFLEETVGKTYIQIYALSEKPICKSMRYPRKLMIRIPCWHDIFYYFIAGTLSENSRLLPASPLKTLF